MRLLIILAILALPIAEIWILISLADIYGWWVVAYLVAMIVLGLQLIRNEKDLLSGYLMQSLIHNKHPAKVLFGSARNILAGVLLIIPGVITDIFAAVLLLIPLTQSNASSTTYRETSFRSADGNNFDYQPDPEPELEPEFKPDFKSRQSQSKTSHYYHDAANDDVIEGEFKRED